MLPACLLVTTYLCIPASYVPVTQSFDMAGIHHKVDKNVVKTLGVQINVVWTDVLQSSPAGLLNRVCEGKSCLYYFKHCNTKRMGCSYLFGELQSGKLYLDELGISYKSDKILDGAEDRIYLAYGPKKNRSYVVLSKLKMSAQDIPPSCSTLNHGC